MKTATTAHATAAHQRSTTRDITVAAMLSAVAFVLMFIEFPIPMLIPSFVKMDVSDLPALLGTFALGPVYGVVIELMKNLLHLLIKGTSSAGAGEIFNFTMGAVFAFTAGVIYQLKKTRTGAIIGSVAGALVMAIISVPMNFFVVYPAYVVCYGMPMDAIIGMYQAILPSADSLLKCLVIFNLPFTFAKGLLDALLCYFIYKPLSPLLHGKR
ncbi:MAG: ECF transporter S component [Clostridiales bacterium]|nr:ECF transporter S component [Clostridiales bacterium]